MDIAVWTGKEADFWPVVGPLATNERIVTALGGKPITHALGKTWFVANREGRAIGFTTMRLDTGMVPYIEVMETYIDPLQTGSRVVQLMSDRRRRAVGAEKAVVGGGETGARLLNRLLWEAHSRWPTLPVRVAQGVDEERPDLEALGFRESSRTKRLVTLELTWTTAPPPIPPAATSPARSQGVEVRELEGDAVFEILGRFAMDPAVTKALGLCLTHSDKKRWFVGRLDGAVAGFGCIEQGRADTVHFRHSYILPERRGQGVYRALLDRRLALSQGKRILTTATAASRPILERRGFAPDPGVTQRGQYTVMLLDRRAKGGAP